ncbi:3 beta-hydroxysteroid dehydrogenase/Delta 5--_4-isomerase [compost metagenome]
MKNVFVTGASGLLGTNLIHSLVVKGFFVKALVRNKNSYKGEKHLLLELIEGDLFEDLSSKISGCDCIIHVAAETRQHLLHYSDYHKTNCEATINVFQSGLLANTKKFIFVSSANTLGHGDLSDLGSENKTARIPFNQSFYAKSKLVAENYLLENKHKMDVIIVNPTFMLGAYDSKPSSGKILLMGWKKRLVFYPPGGKSFVSVKDVAEGIIACIEKGQNGEKYLLSNENLNYKEFFSRLNMLTNQHPIMIEIPRNLLLLIGVTGNVLRFLGLPTSISLANMRMLCQDNFFTNRKSVTHLGIQYQPIDNAIIEAIEYFKSLEK